MLGILEAIICTIAWTCPAFNRRPGYSLTMTEALGLVRLRMKIDCSGRARCTRALSTAWKASTERTSSASRAWLYRAVSMKVLVVSDWSSCRISIPGRLLPDSPCEASNKRASDSLL